MTVNLDRPQRRYLSVEGRAVHYRRLGAGPPLVMLHGSPGDSAMLEPEMAAAAARFTCYALDTPGFGGSDPLPGEVLSVADLARATAAAMRALDLPPCVVFGTHTGAAVGIELGVGWPLQVTGLVLEGLPMFTEDEIAAIFTGYFAPMIPDPLGGHLTSTWVRFRDQFTWFPWLSRDFRRLNPVDRPTPEDIDGWVSMFYRSCKTYGPAYRAACFYGQGAFRAAEALRVPAVYMASAEDMLFAHLDRLPPLKPDQRIERVPYDAPAKYRAIVDFVQSLTASPPMHGGLVADVRPVGGDPGVQFVDAPEGQVFVRAFGAPSAPATILLHDAPGTGLALQDLARTLATWLYVLVPDLPANGASDPPHADACVLEAAASAVVAIAEAFDLDRFTIGAVGCGGAVAAALAARGDARLVALALFEPPTRDVAAAHAIAPELDLSPEGAHWVKAWLMVRDAQIYRPWFDGRIAAQRRTQGNFDAARLHDQAVALMQARTSYHRLPRAAWLFDTAAALATAAIPVSLVEDGDFAGVILSLTLQKAA